MRRGEYREYRYKDHWYIPLNSFRLAAGIFLSFSPNFVEEHVELPSSFHHGTEHYVGSIRRRRDGHSAAWVQGDSMIERGIHDGDLVIFRRDEFDHLHVNDIVVVEKTGDEEGFGAWALKRLIYERPRTTRRNEFDDEIDWEQEALVLRSSNPLFLPVPLDPNGRYRICGVKVRVLSPWEVTRVDSELIHRVATGEE